MWLVGVGLSWLAWVGGCRLVAGVLWEVVVGIEVVCVVAAGFHPLLECLFGCLVVPGVAN